MKRAAGILVVILLSVACAAVMVDRDSDPGRGEPLAWSTTRLLVEPHRVSADLRAADRPHAATHDGPGAAVVNTLPERPVRIESEGGRIVLTGTVGSVLERAAVAAKVQSDVTPFRVENRLAVDPLVDIRARA